MTTKPDELPIAIKLDQLLQAQQQYLYLKDRAESLYQRLTISGKDFEGISGALQPQSKERVMAVFADARTQLKESTLRLLYLRRQLCRRIAAHPQLTANEKQTLLWRIGDQKSIRQIARSCGASDAAIVGRLKRSARKLSDTPQQFYQTLSKIPVRKGGAR